MCEICQMQFGFDHTMSRRGNRVCPRCRRFYIQPQNKTCYHCWVKAGIASAATAAWSMVRRRS